MTVSVVTVTYNAAATVAEAVRSVVKQQGDFTLDYHIVDGGSTDGTLNCIGRSKTALRRSPANPIKGSMTP